ncbi:MAG: SHOCT domain-containing protein [Deltaproteobacteria bacterium]|nr:SHOCT domain-containing protein [Deltaproteobacteria bacterium]
MAIFIVFWVLLFVVLIAAVVTGLKNLEEVQRLRRDRPIEPLLDLKRRFDVGELTREEFQRRVEDELQRERPRRKAS